MCRGRFSSSHCFVARERSSALALTPPQMQTCCTPNWAIGHREGDLITGSRNSFIASLVESRTRYVMLAGIGNKDTASVGTPLAQQVQCLRVSCIDGLKRPDMAAAAQLIAFSKGSSGKVHMFAKLMIWYRPGPDRELQQA